MIEVIDDFLPLMEFEPLESFVTGQSLPWSWKDTITSADSENEAGQFSHQTYVPNQGVCSPHHERIAYPLLSKLFMADPKVICILLRVKLNLNPKQETNNQLGDYHSDFTFTSNYKTGIYYLNSNNGYTSFETGEKVESVANRLVIFDGNIKHVGHSCTDKNARFVLNLNWLTTNV